jgi:hypothetical protein
LSILWLAFGCQTDRPKTTEGPEQSVPATDPPPGTSASTTVLTPDADLESITGETPDPSLLFDMGRVMEIRLEMDDADWSVLRHESRSMFDILAGDCMEAPSPSPYSWFEARVWLDDDQLDDVQVRKKGLIGSQSTTKPGLKLDFDNLVDGRRIHGMERMNLNNTPQDPTMLRNCMAFDYLNRVGVPASRCGFAHVVVNGEDLGIYATVQAVDDHFLEEHGIPADAPLFEGTLSDFRTGWTGTFEQDSETADPAIIEEIRVAVESGQLEEIAALIDIDDFIQFWVAEATLAQWDGYGWNANNFYVYVDPSDGLARFLPWGPDAAWATPYPGGGLDWIPLNNALARALVAIPEVEALYRAEVERQLLVAGDADALVARIRTAAGTIAPWLSPGQPVADLEWYARNQLNNMALSASVAWPIPTTPLRSPLCMAERGVLSYTFEGEWGSIGGGGATPGTCTGTYVWDGVEVLMYPGTFYTGIVDGYGHAACVHPAGPGGAYLMAYNTFPDIEMVPGSVDSDHITRVSTWFYTDDSMGGAWTSLSWVEGTLQLDEADPTGFVRGSYTGTLWVPAW